MNRAFTLILVIGSISLQYLSAQQDFHRDFTLQWHDGEGYAFDGAETLPSPEGCPVYTAYFSAAFTGDCQVTLHVNKEASGLAASLPDNVSDHYQTGYSFISERGFHTLKVWLIPLRKISDGEIAKIISGSLDVSIKPSSGYRNGPEFKTESVLASGSAYRVSVDHSGIFRLDYNFIKDQLQVDPGTLDPNKVCIYTNGSGRVPAWSKIARIDDLEQCATMAVGMDDGKINPGDYFLWYAEGPDAWAYDTTDQLFHFDRNIYDKVNHYYIILGGENRIAIGQRADAGGGDYVSSSSMFFQRAEDEKVNLLGRFRPPGSGQEWYGDEMSVLKQLSFTNRFDFTNMVVTDTFQFATRFAVRSASLSRFYIYFDEKEFSRNVGGLGNNLSNFEASYANDAVITGKFIPGKTFSNVYVAYPTASGANQRAWIDYIEINGWKENKYVSGKPLLITDPRSRYLGKPTYAVSGLPSGSQVWDVSDAVKPMLQATTTAQATTFSTGMATGKIPSVFVCFNPQSDVSGPVFEKAIPKQNLHSIQHADLIIVYYDEFEEAANTLANHRRSFSHLNVEAVPASQVYNEFGGGSPDPAAIRDFARMMYKRDPEFNYLLLIGDATYDFLNHSTDIPYQNFIPAFETEESLDPIRSFPSDDFFALLDDEEGRNLIGAIDIAVGRFPVSTKSEAMDIVNKIIWYDTQPATQKDWRNRIVMVADDEDSNVHVNQADGLATKTALAHSVYNQQKIYLDAYPQQSTPGGDRYPDVNNDIDLAMQKGALTVTYLGHGGPNGWAQERVLGINQAQSYTNLDNMPLFITATCSFAGYDEPGFTSTGEHLLINPGGGAIALMTTVRAVFSGSNERLTDEVLSLLYNEDSPGVYPSVGEVLRRAKNGNAIDTLDNNARKFTLLGDPSLKLAIPRYNMVVTNVQGNPLNVSLPDTLSALETVTISGEVRGDQDELLTWFNGLAYVTLFDKVQIRHTLANDTQSKDRAFNTQTRQLFKGTATVEGGKWTITFVMPKDIDFSYGKGKISLYAENGETDANGFTTDIYVGGVSTDGLTDDQPPVVRLYMNDNQFVSGGVTDANPSIYAELSDDHGINVSGTSIGHDIEAVLDGDTRNSFILNDYYQAAQDEYKEGTVLYPLRNLAEGEHTLTLTAWDLANNVASATITFFVNADGKAFITKVMNYPNPLRDLTYFSFEHNRPNALLDYEVRIYSAGGWLVNTLKGDGLYTGGFREADIPWKGDNQQGAALASGVYVYRIKARFNTGGTVESVESEPGKLVIIY